MTQRFTSASTSINATRLPAVYKRQDVRQSDTLLDYGCGRYTAHIKAALPNTTYLAYDPYNQPDEVNSHTLSAVLKAMETHSRVNVVCSNVLNVIDSDDVVRSIADRIQAVIRATGGTAFITVYEGNRSGIGKQTGSDQYQRNEPLRNYLRFFRNAKIETGTIVIS